MVPPMTPIVITEKRFHFTVKKLMEFLLKLMANPHKRYVASMLLIIQLVVIL